MKYNKELVPMGKNTEVIYDEQISPLMTKIIKICKENKIPTFCTFQLTERNDEEDALFCTTNLPFKGMENKFNKFTEASNNVPDLFAYTIITNK